MTHRYINNELIVPIIIVCFFIALPGRSFSAPLKRSEIIESFENSNFRATLSFEQRQIVKRTGSKVQCGGFNKAFEIKLSNEFSTTSDESLMKEILLSYGASIDIGIEEVSLSGKIELSKKLIQTISRTEKHSIFANATQSVEIQDLQCYDQEFIVIYDRAQYTLTGIKKGYLFDKEFHMGWSWNTDYQIMIEAKFNEDCAGCEIDHGRGRVEGRAEPGDDGSQLWVYVPYERKKIYIVPLFWEDQGKILDIRSLIPSVQ